MNFVLPEKFRAKGVFQLSTEPGDFSQAAWYLVAGLLDPNGDLQLNAVAVQPHKTVLLKYLILMGAPLRMSNHRWVGSMPVADFHSSPAKKIFPVRVLEADLSGLLPELSLLGLVMAFADGVSELPACAQTEPLLGLFERLGVRVDRTDTQFKVHGPAPKTYTLVQLLAMAQGDSK